MNEVDELTRRIIQDLNESIQEDYMQNSEADEMLHTMVEQEDDNTQTAVNIPQHYMKQSPISDAILDTVPEQEDDNTQTISQILKDYIQTPDSSVMLYIVPGQEEIIDLDKSHAISNIPQHYMKQSPDSDETVHSIDLDNTQTVRNDQQDWTLNPSSSEMQNLTVEGIHSLLPYQIPYLRQELVPHLKLDQLKHIEVHQSWHLDPWQLQHLESWYFPFLKPEQIKHLSPLQMTYLIPEQIQHLEPDQLQYLKTHQLKHLELEQIQYLTLDQIQNLAPDQLQHLESWQIQYLSPHQIKHLKSWQIIALKPEQIPYLKLEQIRQLQVDQVASLQPDQVASLQPEQIGYMTSTQVQALTQKQIKALKWQHINILEKDLTQEQKVILVTNICVNNFKDSKNFQDFMMKVFTDIEIIGLKYIVNIEELEKAFNNEMAINKSGHPEIIQTKPIWNCLKCCDSKPEQPEGDAMSVEGYIQPPHPQSRSFQEYVNKLQLFQETALRK